jgi:hypothetical protein
MMDKVAMYLGYGLMAASGVAAFAGIVYLVTEVAWLQVRRVNGLKNIVSALRAHADGGE